MSEPKFQPISREAESVQVWSRNDFLSQESQDSDRHQNSNEVMNISQNKGH